MKKLLLATTLAVLSLGAISYVYATPTPAPDYEQCTFFKNVSASIQYDSDHKRIRAYFKNGNDNPVMVHWEIKAYNSAGNYVTIGSGQTKIFNDGYGYWIPVEGYSGWGIQIRNCN